MALLRITCLLQLLMIMILSLALLGQSLFLAASWERAGGRLPRAASLLRARLLGAGASPSGLEALFPDPAVPEEAPVEEYGHDEPADVMAEEELDMALAAARAAGRSVGAVEEAQAPRTPPPPAAWGAPLQGVAEGGGQRELLPPEDPTGGLPMLGGDVPLEGELAPPEGLAEAPPPRPAVVPAEWGAPLQGGGEEGASGGARATPAAPSAARPALAHTSADLFCSSRAEPGAPVAASSELPLGSFVSAGGRLPIMMVAGDRAELLRRTLASLLSARCVLPSDVLVVRDGDAAGVGEALAAAGVAGHIHQRSGGEAAGLDGAARIASHYRYALAHAFEVAFPGAPGVIVAEDDFLFAPDVYEYFHAVAPLLDGASGSGLWLASAWNDNGFDYLVAEPLALRRTSYFPGLGWLLPRVVWEGELAGAWPGSHWDHWMRDPARRAGRELLIPEVPRVYHAGVRGTFMDAGTHNRLFGSIALQGDGGLSWDSPAAAAALGGVRSARAWAARGARLRAGATGHIGAAGDPRAALLALAAGSPLAGGGLGAVGGDGAALAAEPRPGDTLVLWYDCPTGAGHEPFRPLAALLGIWHEGGRGSRAGQHELWWGARHVRLLTINVAAGPPGGHESGGIEAAPELRAAMPAGLLPAPAEAFAGPAGRALLPRHARLFGARLLSPLAHLSGGADANGPPDSEAEEAPEPAADAALQLRLRGAMPEPYKRIEREAQRGKHRHTQWMQDWAGGKWEE